MLVSNFYYTIWEYYRGSKRTDLQSGKTAQLCRQLVNDNCHAAVVRVPELHALAVPVGDPSGNCSYLRTFLHK